MKALTPVAWLIAVMVTSCVLSGCGENDRVSSGSDSQSTASAEGAQALPTRGRLMNMSGGGHVKGRSRCFRATVRRGVQRGELWLRARCRGIKNGGGIALVLLRYRSNDMFRPLKDPFAGWSLNISGADMAKSAVSCRSGRRELICGADAHGIVSVVGRLRVAPNTRCSATVSVVGVTVEECDGQYCEGSPVLDGLFDGLPRGCPQEA